MARSVRKWNETLFQSLSYTLLVALDLYVVYDKEWAYDRDLFYKDRYNQHIGADLRLMYLVQLGFYVHCGISHVLWERQLSDFWVCSLSLCLY